MGLLAALGQEDGESVRHVALLHQVGDEGHREFEGQPIIDVLETNCRLVWFFVLKLELLVQLAAQLRLERIQDSGLLHLLEQLLLEGLFVRVRSTAGRANGVHGAAEALRARLGLIEILHHI